MITHRKIKAAVIGCGNMGHNDISDLRESPYISQIVGCDLNQERLQLTKEKFGISITDKIEDIWADKDIELVYITTPNVTHVPLAVTALYAGKSVMTEKPAGISYEQIDELIAAQRETGGFLQVGLECRNYS